MAYLKRVKMEMDTVVKIEGDSIEDFKSLLNRPMRAVTALLLLWTFSSDDDLEAWKAPGHLELHVGLPKTYVQALIQKESARVAALLK